jgi:hypothetical protein
LAYRSLIMFLPRRTTRCATLSMLMSCLLALAGKWHLSLLDVECFSFQGFHCSRPFLPLDKYHSSNRAYVENIVKLMLFHTCMRGKLPKHPKIGTNLRLRLTVSVRCFGIMELKSMTSSALKMINVLISAFSSTFQVWNYFSYSRLMIHNHNVRSPLQVCSAPSTITLIPIT